MKQQEAEKAAHRAEVARHLDRIAESFAAGDYGEAVGRSRQAIEAVPDDSILPFVYSQSLFARGEYNDAASAVREALRKVDIDTHGVFYPRRFYPDENILTGQIAELIKTAENEQYNEGLQLLLGYQLLGVGRYDEALDALKKAERDYVNKEATARLRAVLEQARRTELSDEQPEEKANDKTQQGY